jgi:hypothetical protein
MRSIGRPKLIHESRGGLGCLRYKKLDDRPGGLLGGRNSWDVFLHSLVILTAASKYFLEVERTTCFSRRPRA